MYYKDPWCWGRLKAGEQGDHRGWDGWMASPTQWTWVWVNSGSWWCFPTITSVAPFSSCLQSFPASGEFWMSWLSASGSWSNGVSLQHHSFPMNTQDWFPLGLTGWISLQSKRLSRVFSSTSIQKHQFFGAQHSFGPALISVHDYWKNPSFDCVDLCQQSDVSAF